MNFHLLTGKVIWNADFLVTIGCKSNGNFPFDEYECVLKIASRVYDVSNMVLNSISSEIGIAEFTDNSEWKLQSTSVEAGIVDTMAFVDFMFTIRRGSSFYSVFIISPTLLISILHLFVFFVPKAEPARVDFSIKCVMTIVITFLVTQMSIPHSSYPVSIVLFYFITELFINSLITVAVILLSSFDAERICQLMTTTSTVKVRPLSMEGNRKTRTETGNAWGDEDSHSNTDDNSSNVEHSKDEKNTKITFCEVCLFLTFLILHIVATLGFFLPLGLK